MYERFYGLNERAFDLASNLRFLLLTATHAEALANLEYGVTSRQGITLLVGEAGTGKTIVLQKALGLHIEGRGPRVASMFLNNPTLTRAEFFEFISTRFHLGADAAASKTRLLLDLEQNLRERRSRGEVAVLVIDEAQHLPEELLEEIRLLSNIELGTEKLLPIVLSGQPELASKLNRPELRQLKQRIALRCTLTPLSINETAAFIAGRIRLAGGDAGRLFSREAVVAVFEHAHGVPRIINVICENALLNGFALQRRQVDAALIAEVCRDFDLESLPRPVLLEDDAQRSEPVSPPDVRPFITRQWPNFARHFSKRAAHTR
jgi:general secretion pathway protein A